MSHAKLVHLHLKPLPESTLTEVSDFAQFIERKQAPAITPAPREPGSAKGLIRIADDFNAPLDDFTRPSTDSAFHHCPVKTGES